MIKYYTFTTLGLIVFTFIGILIFCDSDTLISFCGDYDLYETDSPSRTYTAIIYTRDCGVTSSSITHAKIRWNFFGGIFSKDLFSFNGEGKAKFEWESDEILNVRILSFPDISEKKEPFGIKISIEKTE